MNYIVQYDKLVAENTWLEGLQKGFKHEIEAAKYGRELTRSSEHANIKIYQLWLLKLLNTLGAYICFPTFQSPMIPQYAMDAFPSVGYGGGLA